MDDTVNPQGNPQGKGVVMVLQQMAAAAPAEIRPKSADEALLDYWCSSLVLSAAFKFRVAPDNTYFLYRVGLDWQLSLIAPDEWGARIPGDFVAECQLSPDMTWQLQFDDNYETKMVRELRHQCSTPPKHYLIQDKERKGFMK